MQVKLIDYTGAGTPNPARHAANVLVFTKQTRLKMTPDLYEEIASWDDAKIENELEYMSRTIPSSWEFSHYGFLITGVTRGFTHQFVRTRPGAYAQQTMRILDVGGWEYGTGPTIEGTNEEIYDDCMADIADAYNRLIERGVAIEDARGVLPTNILTNIYADFNLRTISELVRKRSSGRTQGEYREVLEDLKAEVVRVHPWADMFLNRSFDAAAKELEAMITAAYDKQAATVGIKLIDEMRKG